MRKGEHRTEEDVLWMRQALAEAEKALEAGEVPIGAVIVGGGRVLARAYNRTETLCDVTAHAEMQAFTAASDAIGAKYLQECTLYVTLEPCPMCAGAAYWTQIGRIVYGATDAKHAQVDRQALYHPKTKVVSGVLATECAALLQAFFARKRKASAGKGLPTDK